MQTLICLNLQLAICQHIPTRHHSLGRCLLTCKNKHQTILAEEQSKQNGEDVIMQCKHLHLNDVFPSNNRLQFQLDFTCIKVSRY